VPGATLPVKTAVLFLFLFVGCGKSLPDLNRLASEGQIDSAAPVQADLQTAISAKPAAVWAILIDAREWPSWNLQIESVEAQSSLRQGMKFSWKIGGTRITSEVQVANANRRLAWTGTAFTAKAIHVWELSSGPGDQTIVRIRESMDGPFMKQILTSSDLADADRQWLAALKRAAEQKR
jgi:Polyketide cyclase / dehydrase and lipid transport